MKIRPQLTFQLQVQNWAEAQDAIQREIREFFGDDIPEHLVVSVSAEAEHYETARGAVLAFWDLHVRAEAGR